MAAIAYSLEAKQLTPPEKTWGKLIIIHGSRSNVVVAPFCQLPSGHSSQEFRPTLSRDLAEVWTLLMLSNEYISKFSNKISTDLFKIFKNHDTIIMTRFMPILAVLSPLWTHSSKPYINSSLPFVFELQQNTQRWWYVISSSTQVPVVKQVRPQHPWWAESIGWEQFDPWWNSFPRHHHLQINEIKLIKQWNLRF